MEKNKTVDISNNIKKFNYKTNINLNIDTNSIPTLVPEETLKLFMEGDNEPYYKIQEIEYPILANGYNYTESFFESFLSKANTRPIPGSKSGHNPFPGTTPSTDLILIGGKILSNGDGTGKVYFKNYIPKKLDSDNESLIKQSKAGMIHFSLVTYTKDEIVIKEDGSRQINVVQSLYGERNDVVEYETGAMEQKTNMAITVEDTVANNKLKGDNFMEELLEKISALKKNGDFNVSDFAAKIGIEVKTEEDKQNAILVSNYKSLIGSIEDAEKILEEKKANIKSQMSNEIIELFGAEKVNGRENRAHLYATNILKDCIEAADKEAFDKKINMLKEDVIAKELKAHLADPFSEENIVGEIESREEASVEKWG